MELRLGVFTDLQYYDGPPQNGRYYRNSLLKLSEIIKVFNQQKLDHVFNLGDTIDRHLMSYTEIMSLLHEIDTPLSSLAGNHDFAVADSEKHYVYQYLEMPVPYYSMDIKGVKFILLDGNEVSTYAHLAHSKQYNDAVSLINKLVSQNELHGQYYNGAISDLQLHWLREELRMAKVHNQIVVVMCHEPLYPANKHNLLNAEVVLAELIKYEQVKLVLSGHNHAGNYGLLNHIHFVNLKGVVETEQSNAFGLMEINNKGVRIIGFGREVNRELYFR